MILQITASHSIIFAVVMFLVGMFIINKMSSQNSKKLSTPFDMDWPEKRLTNVPAFIAEFAELCKQEWSQNFFLAGSKHVVSALKDFQNPIHQESLKNELLKRDIPVTSLKFEEREDVNVLIVSF